MIAALGACGWACALALGAVAVAQRRRLGLVADAEHELRGPASTLTLVAESLARDGGGPTGNGALSDAICGSSALEVELERLRGGLADLAAARRGTRRSPPRGIVPLHGLVGGAAAGWSAVARRLGRELVLDWRAGPVRVSADRSRLAQLLGNLLSNAVEHGGGRIELRGERRGRVVRIEVRDEGSGAVSVPVENAVPAPLGDAGSKADGVSGRGLEIARRAVQDARGTLRLERAGGGVRAVVELPVAHG